MESISDIEKQIEEFAYNLRMIVFKKQVKQKLIIIHDNQKSQKVKQTGSNNKR